MATYTVRKNQNIYDVALHIYGSIEGVFDLLISNSELGYDDELTAGQELEYHTSYVQNEAVVDKMEEECWVPVNSERKVYYRTCEAALLFYCKTDEGTGRVSIAVSGSGTIYIDWGDNSEIEEVNLSDTEVTIVHAYENSAASYTVKIYSDDVEFTTLNVTGLGGDMYLTNGVVVEEFTCNDGDMSLAFLSLVTDTYSVDLSGMEISSLESIYDMNLMTLNLTGAKFTEEGEQTAYLEYVVGNFTLESGDRQDCTVYLAEPLDDAGEEAVTTLLSEHSGWEVYYGTMQYVLDEDETLTATDVGGMFPYSFPFAL